jgi:hypothetical protein
MRAFVLEVDAMSGSAPGMAETMGAGAAAGHLATPAAVSVGKSVASEKFGEEVRVVGPGRAPARDGDGEGSMRTETNRWMAVACLLVALVTVGCARKFKAEEKAIAAEQVNCATAEGDIRVLQAEKAHVAEQIALGVTAIYPAGLVVGLLTGTEGTKVRVASGEYNRKIDEKISQIRTTCGLR